MFSRVATTNVIKSIGIRSMATTISWTDMGKSKHDFVHFVNGAVSNPSGPHAGELNKYLNKCFVDNDSDYDGLVSFSGFNNLIHEAATAPRRFGFAPHTRETYKTKEDFTTARKALFSELCGGGERVPLEAWVSWANAHIVSKDVGLLEHREARWERSKADFVAFVKGVASDHSNHCKRSSTSTQYKEFYLLINNHFLEADHNNDGFVSATGFGTLASLADTFASRFGYDWFSGVDFADVAVEGRVTCKGWFDFSVGVLLDNARAL
jgi:hypothetical protein